MRLSEDALFDYVTCPVRYEIIYHKGLKPLKKESATSPLDKTALYFLEGLEKGEIYPLSALKDKLEVYAEGGEDTRHKKAIDNLSLIHKFYLHMEDKRFRAAHAKKKYTLTIDHAPGRLALTGAFRPILSDDSGHLFFYLADFSNKKPTQAVLDMNLKLSLSAYALYRLYQKRIGIYVHHVKTNTDYFTIRTKDDDVRLLSFLESIHEALKRDLIYPRETHFCTSCEYLSLCRLWKKEGVTYAT